MCVCVCVHMLCLHEKERERGREKESMACMDKVREHLTSDWSEDGISQLSTALKIQVCQLTKIWRERERERECVYVCVRV